MTNTAIIVAINDAKLELTTTNRDKVLAGLIRTAQDNGNATVAGKLTNLAVRNDLVLEAVYVELSRIAVGLYGYPMGPEPRTDADVARDEQAREHDHAAADETAREQEDARDDLVNALDTYARRMGLLGLTEDELAGVYTDVVVTLDRLRTTR